MDNGGHIDWTRHLGGAHEDRGYGIAVTPVGQVYVTGSFVGPGIFSTNTVLAGEGMRDVFLAKFDTDGKFNWARQGGGRLNDEGRRGA